MGAKPPKNHRRSENSAGKDSEANLCGKLLPDYLMHTPCYTFKTGCFACPAPSLSPRKLSPVQFAYID